MPKIKVNTDRLNQIKTDVNSVNKKIGSIKIAFDTTKNNIDWDISTENNIRNIMNFISQSLDDERQAMMKYSEVLSVAISEYDNVENRYKQLGHEKSEAERLEELLSYYGEFDGDVKNNIPKGALKLIKKLLKYEIKNSKLGGTEKIFDIKDIIDDIRDGEYLDAVNDGMGLLDLKAWNFTDADLMKGWKTFSENGVLKGDDNLLKAQIIIKTLKLTYERDGYIQNNNEKYIDEASMRIQSGDIMGGLSAIPADFVQTVGKGSVDVACQVVSSYIDSYCSTLTGGLMDLSTFNALCEDKWGHSAGTLFNHVTDKISAGVDFLMDDILIDGSSLVGKALGNTVKAGIATVKSGIEYLSNIS